MVALTSISLDKTYVPSIDHDTSDDDQDFTDHYCIRIKPHRCDCGKLVDFVECGEVLGGIILENHVVVVWPEKDDPDILETARRCQANAETDVDPHIVQYRKSYGKPVPYRSDMHIVVRINNA